MSVKTLVTTLLSVTIFATGLLAQPAGRSRTFREALRLYDSGMYDQARDLFSEMSGDPLCDGYAVLCALKLRSAD